MNNKILSIGFSPCPNDTFIFDAMVNGKIDTEGLQFEVYLEDVETLNQWSESGRLDITKLSFRTLLEVLPIYKILNAGSALGKGCGPLLIAKKEIALSEISRLSIAIPGEKTTAAMLLSYAFPDASKRRVMVFSEIEDAVLKDQVDLGLIIHESRFTYKQKGLVSIVDLGTYWEEHTGSAIPLGGIGIRRNLSTELQHKIDRLIRNSLEYAFGKYPELSGYTTCHAQEMEEQVMRQHIDLYVNEFSLDLGEIGKNSIHKMMQVAQIKVPIASDKEIFV